MGLTIVFMWRDIAERDVYGAPWAARFTPRSFFLLHGGKQRALSDPPASGPSLGQGLGLGGGAGGAHSTRRQFGQSDRRSAKLTRIL
jgi:hypothetical protein